MSTLSSKIHSSSGRIDVSGGGSGTFAGVKVAQKIKKLIEEQDESIAELARRAGLTYSTLYNIKAAPARNPEPATMLAMGRLFGVSLEWLADESKGWPPMKSTEMDRVEGLLTPEQYQGLRKLSEQYDGSEVCFVAALDALLSLPPKEQEIFLNRVQVRKLKMQRDVAEKRDGKAKDSPRISRGSS